MANDVAWTLEAQAKLKTIPFFGRAQARRRIEAMACAPEAEEITAD